jgi:hypothetical protein
VHRVAAETVERDRPCSSSSCPFSFPSSESGSAGATEGTCGTLEATIQSRHSQILEMTHTHTHLPAGCASPCSGGNTTRLSTIESVKLLISQRSAGSWSEQHMSLGLFVHWSVCLSVCMFVCLSVCLSVRLSVCPSVCLPQCAPTHRQTRVNSLVSGFRNALKQSSLRQGSSIG